MGAVRDSAVTIALRFYDGCGIGEKDRRVPDAPEPVAHHTDQMRSRPSFEARPDGLAPQDEDARRTDRPSS